MQQAAWFPGQTPALYTLDRSHSASNQAQELGSKGTPTEYTVDRIVRQKGNDASLKYKVRWYRYFIAEDTFETLENPHRHLIRRHCKKKIKTGTSNKELAHSKSLCSHFDTVGRAIGTSTTLDILKMEPSREQARKVLRHCSLNPRLIYMHINSMYTVR